MGKQQDTGDKNIVEVLNYLRSTTDQLTRTTPEDLDLDAIEKAIVDRQRAVARLSVLIAEYPDGFTESHLEHVRDSHVRGKRALETLLEKRRDGWSLATGLSQNEYVLKTFAQLDSLPDQSVDA